MLQQGPGRLQAAARFWQGAHTPEPLLCVSEMAAFDFSPTYLL